MKKKTVITTETHEVWVIRETTPEPAVDQTINPTNAIDVTGPDGDLQEPDGCNDEEKK